MSSSDESLTVGQVIMPAVILGIAVFAWLCFQGVQVLRDRDSLHQFIENQEKPLENSQNIEKQLSALALGTKKLAEGGDKNAIAIINRMQQNGITVAPPPATATPVTAPSGAMPGAPTTPKTVP